MDIRIKTFYHTKNKTDEFDLDEKIESWKERVGARILTLQVSVFLESSSKYGQIYYTITYIIVSRKKLLTETIEEIEETIEE